jgi:hypothetical protein
VDVISLCTLRYVGASGRLDQFWQFLPATKDEPNRLLMSIRLGSAPVVVCEIPICTHRSSWERMRGCWVIVPRGEDSFLLTAARVPMDQDSIVHAEAFHENLPVGSIALSDAPADVARALAEI